MPRQQQGVLYARVVFESTSDNFTRTSQFAVQSLKGFARSIKNANIAIAIFDENGKQIGIDVTGDPSTEMEDLMDVEFKDDDPPEVVSA